jgi:hypothetical protein
MPLLPPCTAPLTPRSAKVAHQLLAHARLCREVAARSWNEESARKLEQLADACVRAATSCELLPPDRVH